MDNIETNEYVGGDRTSFSSGWRRGRPPTRTAARGERAEEASFSTQAHMFSTSPNVPSAVTAGSPTHTGPGGTSEMAPPSILGSEEFRVNVTELRPERQEARRRWKFEQGLGVRTQGWAPQGGVWASLRHASPSPQHPWVQLLCVPCWMGLLIMVADFELYGAPSFHTR